MKEGPDIARLGALIGDPARANILTALMSGKALTATELALEAGVSKATASSHLRKLEEGALIRQRPEGRHRYFQLADDAVAAALEGLMSLSAYQGLAHARPGPKDPALRKARVCYNHLAGEMGVRMFQYMQSNAHFAPDASGLRLTAKGEAFAATLGLDIAQLPKSNAPMCRECLDWSARQSHLAGRLGRALLTHFLDQGWARRVKDSRIIDFSPEGLRRFEAHFGRAAS